MGLCEALTGRSWIQNQVQKLSATKLINGTGGDYCAEDVIEQQKKWSAMGAAMVHMGRQTALAPALSRQALLHIHPAPHT